MKNKKKAKLNKERIIIGFRNKKNHQFANLPEILEEQFFKEKKVIVKFSSSFKIMTVDDVEMTLLLESARSIDKKELPFSDLKELQDALNRYKNWEKARILILFKKSFKADTT